MRHKMGFTLIETLIALAIFAAAVAAIIMMSLQAFSLNAAAKQRSQAIVLAQQNLEMVRSYYQTNSWVGLSGKAGCFTDGSLTTNVSCETVPVVKITVNGTQIFVQSIAGYKDKGDKTLEQDTYFYSY